jgi:hypothetical protein
MDEDSTFPAQIDPIVFPVADGAFGLMTGQVRQQARLFISGRTAALAPSQPIHGEHV